MTPTPVAPPERPPLSLEARRVLGQIVRLILEDPGPDRPSPAAACPARPTKKAA